MRNTLNLVSVGPGTAELITPAAESAIKSCEAVVAYDLYLNWIRSWVENKQVITLPLTQERARVHKAIELARGGANVCLISSGDIGVYGLAPLLFEELADNEPFDVKVIPGVTAATASASLLGSPLSHDFVVLSLSDLLCPWEWIEARAEAAARADLCLALYNVQSAKRQEGIYKIIAKLLEHKGAGTICGAVRNAYREEQNITIATLDELSRMSFDMFTCIVIGNRFTRRKGQFMYTPRGYNNWSTEDHAEHEPTVPKQAVWVFAGTSDGNQLASEIRRSGQDVVISVASEYGATVASASCEGATVVSGSLGAAKREALLTRSQAACIVDATHPYAESITEQLRLLATAANIPYVRYERPSSAINDQPGILLADSVEDAATKAAGIGRRIFLSTGSKDLARYLGCFDTRVQLYLRVAADPRFVQRAVELGIPRERICAMQGPFSSEFNQALWRSWKIDAVITKDSGYAGGFDAKVDAARALNIPLVVVRRPASKYPAVSTFEEVLNIINQRICV